MSNSVPTAVSGLTFTQVSKYYAAEIGIFAICMGLLAIAVSVLIVYICKHGCKCNKKTCLGEDTKKKVHALLSLAFPTLIKKKIIYARASKGAIYAYDKQDNRTVEDVESAVSTKELYLFDDNEFIEEIDHIALPMSCCCKKLK